LERGSPEKDATSGYLKMRDATLLALAKAGDDNAYVELIKHCSPSRESHSQDCKN
jgi:hypothetical protein